MDDDDFDFAGNEATQPTFAAFTNSSEPSTQPSAGLYSSPLLLPTISSTFLNPSAALNMNNSNTSVIGRGSGGEGSTAMYNGSSNGAPSPYGAGANTSTGSGSAGQSSALLDLSELYKSYERGDLASGGGGGGDNNGGFVGEGGQHEGSRNFQAMLTLPTDKLPKTVLPRGVGPGSIRASLKAFVGSGRSRGSRKEPTPSVLPIPVVGVSSPSMATQHNAQIQNGDSQFSPSSTTTSADQIGTNTTAQPTHLSSTNGADQGAVDHEAAAAAAAASALSPLTDMEGLNSNGYMWRAERKERIVWTEEETRRFFDALQQYGTDFTLVSILFPGRRRQDIQRKYKQEWKLRPRLVEEALHAKAQTPVDLQQLDEGLRLWGEHNKPAVVPLTEEEERLLRQLGGNSGGAAASTTDNNDESATGGDGNDFDFGGSGGGDFGQEMGSSDFSEFSGRGGGEMDPFTSFGDSYGHGNAFGDPFAAANSHAADSSDPPSSAPPLISDEGNSDFGFIYDPSAAARKGASTRAKKAPAPKSTKRAREEAFDAAAAATARAKAAEEHGEFGFN